MSTEPLDDRKSFGARNFGVQSRTATRPRKRSATRPKRSAEWRLDPPKPTAVFQQRGAGCPAVVEAPWIASRSGVTRITSISAPTHADSRMAGGSRGAANPIFGTDPKAAEFHNWAWNRLFPSSGSSALSDPESVPSNFLLV
jgi:hypothetical protein